MSGQPYKYASDPARFRQDYMNTLKLQIDINEMNFEANKTFKATGQLPAVSQMSETRTTSELLADAEKVKQSLMADMKELGTPNFCLDVIQTVQKSPLNIDGSLFTFFAQRAPEIVANVKRQYKFGIKGDKNDVAQFVTFIEDMYNKTKSFSSSVKTYFNRPADSVASRGAISFGDLEALQKMFFELARKLALVNRDMDNAEEDELHEKLGGIISNLSLIEDIMTNYEYIENTKEFISRDLNARYVQESIIPEYTDTYMPGEEIYSGQKYIPDNVSEMLDEFWELYYLYNEKLENFPKSDTLFNLVDKLHIAADRKDIKFAVTIANKIEELLLPSLTDFAVLARRLNLIRKVLEEFESKSPYDGFDDKTISSKSSNSSTYDSSSWTSSGSKSPYDETMSSKSSNSRTFDSSGSKNSGSHYSEGYDTSLPSRLMHKTPSSSVSSQSSRPTPNIIKGNKIFDLDVPYQQDESEGSGIKKKRGRGRPKGSGIQTTKTFKDSFLKHKDDTMGISESPRYVKFGKYFLNTHKLKGTGILVLRRPGGGNINELPGTRVSNVLSDIVFKMIGGGVPSYSELSKLTEPEKAYLHKISTKANIVDKFSIPAPDKDKAEKDIHDFEVMKGEILAGNDSKELIKKFKLHLIKLSKCGTLPKAEVHEVMEELLQLGF